MAVKDDGEMRAEGEGGSLRGGVAQEQAARLPRAHPRASRQTAAAADIAYTKACSLVPARKKARNVVEKQPPPRGARESERSNHKSETIGTNGRALAQHPPLASCSRLRREYLSLSVFPRVFPRCVQRVMRRSLFLADTNALDDSCRRQRHYSRAGIATRRGIFERRVGLHYAIAFLRSGRLRRKPIIIKPSTAENRRRRRWRMLRLGDLLCSLGFLINGRYSAVSPPPPPLGPAPLAPPWPNRTLIYNIYNYRETRAINPIEAGRRMVEGSRGLLMIAN